MSEQLTSDDVDRIETAAKAATPGPWEWKNEGDQYSEWHALISPQGRILDDGSACGEYNREIEPDSPDGKYIATMSPDVALALVAALRAAWAENGKLQGRVEQAVAFLRSAHLLSEDDEYDYGQITAGIVDCDRCDGKGFRVKNWMAYYQTGYGEKEACKRCNGTGKVFRWQRDDYDTANASDEATGAGGDLVEHKPGDIFINNLTATAHPWGAATITFYEHKVRSLGDLDSHTVNVDVQPEMFQRDSGGNRVAIVSTTSIYQNRKFRLEVDTWNTVVSLAEIAPDREAGGG